MYALLVTVLLLLVACSDGGPDSTGNNDTVFTGLSGIVVLGILIWLVVRHFNKKGKS
jgi:LPXTG-motif cell wall-anchored protein